MRGCCELHGRRFSGAVRYECSGEPNLMAHCQCNRSRMASGSGHSSFLAVREADLALTGDLTFHDAAAPEMQPIGKPGLLEDALRRTL